MGVPIGIARLATQLRNGNTLMDNIKENIEIARKFSKGSTLNQMAYMLNDDHANNEMIALYNSVAAAESDSAKTEQEKGLFHMIIKIEKTKETFEKVKRVLARLAVLVAMVSVIGMFSLGLDAIQPFKYLAPPLMVILVVALISTALFKHKISSMRYMTDLLRADIAKRSNI